MAIHKANELQSLPEMKCVSLPYKGKFSFFTSISDECFDLHNKGELGTSALVAAQSYFEQNKSAITIVHFHFIFDITITV